MQNMAKKGAGALLFYLMFIGGAAYGQTREHADASMTLRLEAAPSVVFPLFGPEREAEWSPHWNPTFLFPAEKAQVAGAVFTTKHGDTEQVWVMDTYDETALRIVYVIVRPGMWVTRLEIVLKAGAENTTEATVTYHDTALTEAGDDHVKENAKEIPGEREHWEHAINHRLAEMKEK